MRMQGSPLQAAAVISRKESLLHADNQNDREMPITLSYKHELKAY